MNPAARLWAAAELRRRWRGMVAIGLLAGLAAGLALAATAGARRTETALPRLKEVTLAADAIVFASQIEIDDPDWSPFDELPYVEATGAFGLAFGDGTIDGEPIEDGWGIFTVARRGWLTEVDRPVVVEGRMFDLDATDEAIVDTDAAAASGIHVGSVIEYAAPSAEQLFTNFESGEPGPSGVLEVVGIVRPMPFNLLFQPEGAYATPAFHEAFLAGGGYSFSNLMVRVAGGAADVARLEADAARLLGVESVPVQDLAADSKRITSGTELETTGLLLFAAAVALAGVLLLQQALTRSVRAGAEDAAVLRSIGLQRGEVAVAMALPHLAAAATGGVAAFAVAVALSARFPLGLGRRVDPDVGFHVDWVVLLPGALAVVAVLAAGTYLSARLAVTAPEQPPARGSALARRARAVLPVAGGVGVGLALDPPRGPRALPSRPALLAGAAGVLGTLGGLTLLAGLDDAVARPERFGQTWDVGVHGYLPDAGDVLAAELPGVEGVGGTSIVRRVPVPVEGGSVPAYSVEPVGPDGGPTFVVTHGRAPAGDGEAALGPATAEHLGVGIGDRIHIGSSEAEVVGIAFLPVTDHSSYDQGLWTSTDVLLAAAGDQVDGGVETTGIVAVADGYDVEDVTAALVERYHGDIYSGELATEPPRPPTELANLRNVRPLPLLFAAFTTLLAIGAIAHVTASVVRRRRAELGVLRALGFTRGQTRSVLLAQASTLALVGGALGLPVGLAVGRGAWHWVADVTPLVYAAPLALVATVVAVPAAVLAANVVAAAPARRAGRLRPAEALRTE